MTAPTCATCRWWRRQQVAIGHSVYGRVCQNEASRLALVITSHDERCDEYEAKEYGTTRCGEHAPKGEEDGRG